MCHLQDTKQDNEYGNYDVITGNFSNMKRHSECKQHQQALAQLGLIEVTADEDAPSMSAFEQVARGRMKGPSALRHGEAGWWPQEDHSYGAVFG